MGLKIGPQSADGIILMIWTIAFRLHNEAYYNKLAIVIDHTLADL